MNPGGSVKDRAARAIVPDAEERGELAPGGVVVEGTAGNTGIGLAHVCNARGYRCVIVMPDNQSPEKYRLLETLGAEVQRVPAVPYSNPNQYQKVAQRLAAEPAERHLGEPVRQHRQPPRAPATPRDRRSGTQTCGRSRRLRRRERHRRHARRGRAVPEDADARRSAACSPIRRAAALYEFVRTGTLAATGGGSITEGIGIARVTANLEGRTGR